MWFSIWHRASPTKTEIKMTTIWVTWHIIFDPCLLGRLLHGGVGGLLPQTAILSLHFTFPCASHATISRFFRTLINNCRVFCSSFCISKPTCPEPAVFTMVHDQKALYLEFSTELDWRNGVVCSSHEPSLCSLDHKRRSTLFKFRNTGMLSANTLIFANILESI